MWMVLHGVPDDICHFNEPAIIFLVQGPQNSPVHWLQPVGQIWDRPIANHIRRIIQKSAIYPPMQRQVNLARLEWMCWCGSNVLRQNVWRAIAVAVLRWLLL